MKGEEGGEGEEYREGQEDRGGGERSSCEIRLARIKSSSCL